MFLSNKEFKVYTAIMIILLLIPALLTLSDSMTNLNESSKRPLKNNEGTRISTALLPAQRRDLAILAEDFSCDQVYFKSMKRELYTHGFSTFTFDFRGQGRSWGKLPLKKEKDEIASELKTIEEQLLSTSLFTTENFNYIGHGMGANALLKATVKNWIHPKRLILIAPTLSDQPLKIKWLNQIQSNHFNFPTTIITSQWDDKSKPDHCQQLIDQIRNRTPQNKNQIKLIILQRLPHPYQPYSSKMITTVIEQLETNTPFQTNLLFSFYPTLRTLALISGFLALVLVPLLILFKKREKSVPVRPKLKDYNLQFLSWIGASFIFGVFFFLIYKIPMAKPLPALVFPLLIGSYGLIKWLLYSFSPQEWGLKKRSELINQFKINNCNRQQRFESFRVGGSIAAFYLIVLILLARLGLFYAVPFNSKQIWLWIILILVFPAFYTASIEVLWENSTQQSNLGLALIRWIPFLIIPFLMLISGKISALVNQCHYNLLLFIILLMGRLMLKAKVTPIQVAFSQALLYSLMAVSKGAIIQI